MSPRPTQQKRPGGLAGKTAKALYDARIAAGLAMREVRRKTGISAATISNYELGRYDPTLGNLRKLAKCYGLTVTELIPDR